MADAERRRLMRTAGTAVQLVGLPVDEAEARSLRNGCQLCVVHLDVPLPAGVARGLITNLVFSRITAVARDNIVESVSVG